MNRGTTSGLLSAIFWGLNAVLLGIALSSNFLIEMKYAAFLVAFLSDLVCLIILIIKDRLNMNDVLEAISTKKGKLLILAAILSGPIGTAGYALSIKYMGACIGAIASTIYPAIGCILARVFLKDKMTSKQYIALVICSICIYVMSFSPEIEITNFILGLLGTIMCSLGWGCESVLIAISKTSVSTNTMLKSKYLFSTLTYSIAFIVTGTSITLPITSANYVGFTVIVCGITALVSYFFYYDAIDKIGPSKAMCLNMTYVVFSTIFSFMIFENTSLFTIICCIVIMISGMFAAGGLN